MRRIPYVGDAPAKGGGAIPIQAESLAYFARMTTSPSNPWKFAFNEAVFLWKRDGLWSLINELYVHCAETSQAALLGLKSIGTAAVVGSPTFTANKGFSNFNATNGMAYTITAAQMGGNNARTAFCALMSSGGTGVFMECVSHSLPDAPGTMTKSGANGIRMGGWTNDTMDAANTTVPSLAVYCGDFAVTASNQVLGATAPMGASADNPFTRLRADQAIGQVRILGFLAPSTTALQARKFLSHLARFMDSIGALD